MDRTAVALAKKLGIRERARVALHNPPPSLHDDLAPLPEGVDLSDTLPGDARDLDVVVLFATSLADLEAVLPRAVRSIKPSGGLWIAWPKKASGVPTDLSDGLARHVGLATGLVDNKVCAIDATWSALRFVVRVEDR